MQAAYGFRRFEPNFLCLNEKPGEAPSGLTRLDFGLMYTATVARSVSDCNKK